MNLKPGDKIKLKSYDEAVHMYRNNGMGNTMHNYPTNHAFIYGIEWDVYQEISHRTGVVEYGDFQNEFFVDFGGDDLKFFIPKMLIKVNKSIDLPDNLFEL